MKYYSIKDIDFNKKYTIYIKRRKRTLEKITLRAYLFSTLRELYEDTHDLQQKALVTTLSTDEEEELKIKNAKLEIVRNCVEICKERNKY